MQVYIFKQKKKNKNKIYIKKSDTSEEGGTHLRISFWHLLMNMKNKYLLTKNK